jgi:hypothetical protein
MENRSGLLKAGTILLLVGAILQAVGAVVLMLYAILWGAIVRAMARRAGGTGSTPLPGFLSILFVALGILLAVGSLMSFLAHGRARAGDANAAFVRGLVGSLLPPVQIVPLVGAILCKVSPEGEGHGRPPVPPPSPPAQWPPA